MPCWTSFRMRWTGLAPSTPSLTAMGTFYGDNTDGKGYLKACGSRLCSRRRTVLFLGAGGSARAVAVQLALAGWQNSFATALRPELLIWPVLSPGNSPGGACDLAGPSGDKLPEQMLAAPIWWCRLLLGMSPKVYETCRPSPASGRGRWLRPGVQSGRDTIFKKGQAGRSCYRQRSGYAPAPGGTGFRAVDRRPGPPGGNAASAEKGIVKQVREVASTACLWRVNPRLVWQD